MRILVTGGLGFIGHNVVVDLCKRGHTVRVVDNQTDYGVIPFAELNFILAERKKKIPANVLIHQIDIESSAVKFVFEQFRPEAIVHLASFPRQRIVNANPQAGSRVMSEGLLNLLELATEFKTEKFIYASSSMVYGSFERANEDLECTPMGQYAILKLAGEQLVRDYSRRTGMSHVILRPSAVYGPLDFEDRVVSKFLLNAIRGEKLQVQGPWETLDFTHVSEAAHGIVEATLSQSVTWGTYNISRGRVRTLLEAADVAVKTVGSGVIDSVASDPNFPSRGIIDTSAAYRDLDFSANIDIEDGFRDYYTWLLSAPYYANQALGRV
jgi:nucleoside-diphosphate-sugar epimerase